VRTADNLLLSRAVVTKSEKLNFLEASGSLRAYNATALPLRVLGSIVHVLMYCEDFSTEIQV